MNTKITIQCHVLVLLLLISTALFAQRPYFNKNTDILIAQFDSKPDPDDIHAQAALGSMLAHSDLSGVNYYAVAGAVGTQNGTFIDSDALFDMAFGSGNWTDADANWWGSVTNITNKVVPILQNGGKVWVQEAGQSNITADWIYQVLQSVAASTVKSNVIVVQHSNWNEDHTAASDLNYVKDKATYFAIDDGNAPDGAGWGDRGPWSTPEYRSQSSTWMAQAKSSPNPIAKQLWTEADRVIDDMWPNGYPHDWSYIHYDGVDYSDCVENWWIFNIGADADSNSKFWARYVTNTPSGGGNNTVSCASLPSSVASSTSITVSVPYEASQSRDVVVEFWDAGWIAQGKTAVNAGSGTANVTINLSSAPPAGSNYTFKVSIRPTGGDWTTNIDACQKNNVTVTSGSSGQTPYGGTNRTIPGTIEAEHYDEGGEGVAYHDTSTGNAGGLVRSDDVDIEARDGGHNVGWTANGEWLEYTVNATAGTYNLEARVAATSTGKNLVVKLDGTTLGTVNVPNTGDWGTFQTVTLNNITVSGGNDKVLRIEFDGGSVNLNYVRFVSTGSGSCDLPYSNSGFSISNQTTNWSSGALDISCAGSVDISLVAEGVGPMENADYLNIYYKLNGGSQVAILENTNTYSSNTLTVNGLSGNTLELIVNGYTSYSDETYTVSNISVNNASGARQGLTSDPEPHISIYPNPLTSGSVTISLPDQEASAIRIFNVMGQTVYSAEEVKDQLRIPRSQFAAKGIYLVEIATPQKTMQRKLFIR
ncbi:carbohydrate-binding protein [Marinoscillum furvescens]|uniref:Putative secreted protein (Por secretion system target) n=1 Tax=Marinoscillum furvescens DSM 4134 TaxID=1122208 RepID=A0A3D9L3T2_MARFU|nr:carbohydrate-binding domain-containing protein [Marinoscillum furvescens]REE00121.1 putative secreted protein (Por secretion system target) [Marinoscillum furvescens DSM 4134]